MPLTDATVRNAKPGVKSRKLTDASGLYLEVRPEGGKWWRLRYRFEGREKLLSLGTYPDVPLGEARAKRDEMRKLVASGADPSLARKASKLARADDVANSFEALAREWYSVKRDDWSASYGEKIIARLEADVFPYIGRRPVAEVTPPDLLEVLRRVEGRGVVETAHRARENCSQIFRFAVATGRATSDPARDLKDALRTPTVKHFPAITKPERLAELLRACAGYAGTPVVRTALLLAPMLLLRPGELRHAQWSEFDLDAATWLVPAARMKRLKAGKFQGAPHMVPLPTQAVAALRELEPLTGRNAYVFRGERHHDRMMSENTINAALRTMGFQKDEVCGHGFRATVRTMAVERLGVAAEVVEAQLAHRVRDSLGRAYNRTEFLDQRRAMMQLWADYLAALAKGGDVPPMPIRSATS
jgi:integrase